MTDVYVSNEDVIVSTPQPTVPEGAKPPNIGLVEINQVVVRGSIWTTGHGAPTEGGGQAGDLYLDVDTGDIYGWNGSSWNYQGTFAPATLTPEEILAAMLTVDGPGSALDADLLDGQHGAYYAKQADMDAVEAVNATQDGTLADHETRIANNTTNIAAVGNATTINIADIDALEAGLAAEVTARSTADTTLQTNITNEATTRAAADTTLDGKITTEKNRNDAQDTAIALRLTDAPSNANAYGRMGGAWTDVTEEAPNDGLGYMRKNGAWVPSSGGATTDDNPPAGPLQDGQFWWKSSVGVLYLWYVEPGDPVSAGQWVQTAASPQIVDQNYTRKTARTRNRVNNPTAQIAQETTAVLTANGYPADQWMVNLNGITGSSQRINVVSPEGTTTAVNLIATTAKGTLAASDNLLLQVPIEGVDVSDLLWGTGAAKPVVLRFNAWCEQAGTFAFSIRNGASNRSYCGSFTVAVGGWSQVSVAVPGDTTGTWPIDTSLAMKIAFVYAAGPSLVGVAGWQAGSFFAPPGCTNGAAQANKALIITDVGLYADPDNTGLAPPFNAPSYADDMARCQRYWVRMLTQYLFGYTGGGGSIWETYSLPVTMRTAPTVVFINLANASNVSNLIVNSPTPTNITAAVTMGVTGAGVITFDTNVNARLI